MIRVNDKWDVPWKIGMNVQELLQACDFAHPHIVVSVDGCLVPPEQYHAHAVPDGSEVRVVHIIGGG